MNASKTFEAAVTWMTLVLCIAMIGMLASAMNDFNRSIDKTVGRGVTSMAMNEGK